MKQRTYRICIALVAIALAFALLLGLAFANVIIPVIAVVVGIAILALCRRRVTEVTEDELSTILHGKAALGALEITILVAAIGFAALMSFSSGGGSGWGLATYDNGSTKVYYGVLSISPILSVSPLDLNYESYSLYEGSYLIPDPANLTFDDVVALDAMFAEGHRIRDTARAFGAALGMVTVLLAVLYGAFLWYYNRKYGA
ncbi:MAG: DUF2178 domain-containing protein [Methanoculleus sp.]|uniref:DUF2178 domain-containing protein n=1 Tax=unclassified Methanoculleus TaxID=2619537 RepID=UPI0025F797AC|nr:MULTISPECIES: DUF2178 domain-containing protein [unclassified Methanoculleus]MCK9308326.1 DUF2178 domain-containing protein [Methanoculleus sp.]MDD2254003.1 DUF2178 domain-containing protein [Methanoculleus sp.]MDD4471274.1 DUF2178 domain-containing protein [Methanoculleus sp.]HOI62456.1 DUF2178 domain-containing protein [Methanoculleus sp.]